MAGEIQVPYTVTAKDLYSLVRNATGQALRTDTHVFEAYLTANRANYLISLTEQGTASAYYVGTFPSYLPRGVYALATYQRKAGSRAENDIFAGGENVYWDGAALWFPSALPPNFSALGIGSGGHVLNVDTLTTYTGNTPQTGDVFAALPLHFSALGIGSGGHVLTVDTVTTYTGNTPQTGDVFAALPAHFSALGIGSGGHVLTVDTLTTYTGNTPQTGDAFAALVAALPPNFAALGISGSGHILNVDTLTTYTGNTPQTGNVFAALPGNFSALGISGIGHIATVDTLLVNADKVGYTLTQPFPANFGVLLITPAGHVAEVDTITTYTGDTPQTGDVYAHLPPNFWQLGIASTGHILNVDTLTTYTGNTPQTGDVYGQLPTHFANLGISVGGHISTVDTLGSGALGAVTIPALDGVPGPEPSLADAVGWIYVLSRSRRVQTATVETVYAEDGTTPIATSTKADTGTVFTRGKYA